MGKDGKVPVKSLRSLGVMKTVTDCQCSFVMSLVKTFEAERSMYVLTELVTGGSFAEQLKTLGPLGQKEAQFYVGLIVLILEVLHGCAVVHRDLNPESFMLDSQGYLK